MAPTPSLLRVFTETSPVQSQPPSATETKGSKQHIQKIPLLTTTIRKPPPYASSSSREDPSSVSQSQKPLVPQLAYSPRNQLRVTFSKAAPDVEQTVTVLDLVLDLDLSENDREDVDAGAQTGDELVRQQQRD